MDLDEWLDDQRVARKTVNDTNKAKHSKDPKTYKEKKTTEAKPTKTNIQE